MNRHPPRLARLTAAAVGAALLASALSGCAMVTGPVTDGDYSTSIPAALRASDAGVADAYAEKGLDGFSHYLGIGVNLDDDELSETDLARILQIILDGDPPAGSIRLSVQGSDGAFINVDEIVQRIEPQLVPGTADDMLSLTVDQARELIDVIENG